jgi:5-methyltetrahydropteroyltriglutamate--homocysteine methyltransferase
MSLTALPARYDHVGSFLRPQYLLEARAQKAKGQITAERWKTRPFARSSSFRKTWA